MVSGFPLLAHGWGWDEILYFVVPAIAVVLWVRWAEKRARRDKGNGSDPSTNMTRREEP
jgi:membrane protein implicated in regulation of membrane protease activity